MDPDSAEAAKVAQTLHDYEAPTAKCEKKACTTLLESMVDFATTSLRTVEVRAVLTIVAKEGSPKQEYTMIGVKRVAKTMRAGGLPAASVASVRDWRGELAARHGLACGHRVRRAGGHHKHGRRRACQGIAEGCTSSGGRRVHGMRRAHVAIAEGGEVNVRSRPGELAVSSVCVHGQRRGRRG